MATEGITELRSRSKVYCFGRQKLYLPDAELRACLNNIDAILTGPIDWGLSQNLEIGGCSRIEAVERESPFESDFSIVRGE